MIVITGVLGFIGSRLALHLQKEGYNALVGVDNFSKKASALSLSLRVDRRDFLSWFAKNASQVEFIFHMGARSNQQETNEDVLYELNTLFSQRIFSLCTESQVPIVYASSASTYGDGSQGFVDEEKDIEALEPISSYARSKHRFDLWVLAQESKPFFWAGLKFFNVYGHGEGHKRDSSPALRFFRQISQQQQVDIFKSHHRSYADGKQERDFVYIRDVVSICLYLMKTRKVSGIYNVGTGKARTFIEVAKIVFSELKLKENINFIDMPSHIRATYQYHTQADVRKISQVYPFPFTSLEEGIRDYLTHSLYIK